MKRCWLGGGGNGRMRRLCCSELDYDKEYLVSEGARSTGACMGSDQGSVLEVDKLL